MATKEPEAKKRRRTRTIELELDLSQFPKWVGEANNSTLLQVFAIGVIVRDSMTMKITENSEDIENILDEKFKPVYRKVDQIKSEFVDMQTNVTTSLTNMQTGVSQMQNKLVSDIHVVANKVPPLDSLNRTLDSKINEFLTNILDEKFKPVYKKVNQIKSEFVDMQTNVTTSLTKMQTGVSQMQNKLVSDIHVVANKVPPLDSLNRTLDSKINEVLAPIKRCDENLTKLVSKYENPAIKGALGEEKVQSILEDNFPTYTIYNDANQGRKADIHITSTQSRQKYLVEVKNRQKEVPAKEIEKFEKNVRENKDFKVGILFSLSSGINVLASHGRFTIKFKDDQYYIYVPNALNDPRKDLIVWIVILADQLAVLNQGLTDKQTQVVANLLQEFRQSVETSKNCQTHLDALKGSIAALEENMVPLLKVIDNAKRKLHRALNKADG